MARAKAAKATTQLGPGLANSPKKKRKEKKRNLNNQKVF
jgi:hypothetical protein